MKEAKNMNDFMTPPNHINFSAKMLFGGMGEIIDGSIAYLTKDGGPKELHTHSYNHLIVVVKGEAQVVLGEEEKIVRENEAYLVNGSILHGIWNNTGGTTVMVGMSLKQN